MHLRFEKLPREVRDQIYRNVFPCGEILVPGVHYTGGPIAKPFPSLALFQINRQIATEAAVVLFEQNTWQIRMPPIHLCSLGDWTNRNGCTEMRFGERVEEDNHSCTELGCLRGHKQRHLAQRFLRRHGHQFQHAHLASHTYDLIIHLRIPWIHRAKESIMGCYLYDLYDNHGECRSRSTCKKSYIGWRWEGHALRTIATTGLRSMTLDLGDLWFGVHSIDTEDSERYWKEGFESLMQTLFQGLKLRQVTFPQHRTEADAPVAWLNPNFDTEPGSGWIDSLTVINVPWKHCVSVFLAGLEQERYRPAKSSTDAASLPDNLALSHVKEHDGINTWLK